MYIHPTGLPGHIPGHSQESEKKKAQQIQQQWSFESEESESEADATARILANEEAERLTREAGASLVAKELKVYHPPLTKFGLEELETVYAGTPNERLKIKNFDRNEWETVITTAMVSNVWGACGAAAVVHSLKHQYPDEEWTVGLTPEIFLNIWLKTIPGEGDPGRRNFYDEEQLNNAVQRLTNGELQIVFVHKGMENEGGLISIPEHAVMSANGERARYLYVHLTHAGFKAKPGGKTAIRLYQHYEGMKRKPGYKEHK